MLKIPKTPDPDSLKQSKVIGADIPLNSEQYPLKELLTAFRDVAATRSDVKLVLTGKRSLHNEFSVYNFLEENELADRVDFLPYFSICRDFPLKKNNCAVWISRNTPAADLTSDTLIAKLDGKSTDKSKIALFFTCFHPEKYEGNSKLMRHWLYYLKSAAYRVHLIYYAIDLKHTTREMRHHARSEYDLYHEVEVVSRLAGTNKNGLNVHVDDWCGEEAVSAVVEHASRFEYDVAIVNYPFMTAVFDGVSAYTQKILLTHDRFTDRNRRLLAQGYSCADWVSIDKPGERTACRRADVVVALQDDEAEHFTELLGDASAIRVIPPIIPMTQSAPAHRQAGARLRIGYFGSSNWVNEQNLAAYMKAWLASPVLPAQSELILAGGVCETFRHWVDNGEAILTRVAPKMLGRINQLDAFFNSCDIIINPEMGGTGIKIKTLEAMAFGAAVITTEAGAVGILSASRFHSAKDAKALAELTVEIVEDHSLLNLVKVETAQVYRDYCARNNSAMEHLLGPVVQMDNLPSPSRPAIKPTASTPTVSIIVPFYSVEEYITKCIESMVRQDYANIEVILVDDASPDRSRIIVDRFAARDPRIRIVSHEKNRGLGHSRNTGVRNSVGQYIFFLDSDDFLSSSSAISSLVSAAQRSQCRVIVGGSVKLMPDGAIQSYDQSDDQNSFNKSGHIVSGVNAFLAGLRLPSPYYLPLRAWGTLIHRTLYDELAIDFPAGEHEDLGQTPFLYFRSGGVLYIQDIIVTYRIRPGSISNSLWSQDTLRRYRDLWRHFKLNISRFVLDDHLGDAAVAFTIHLIWKLQSNGLDRASKDAAIELIGDILHDVEGTFYKEYLYDVLDRVREFAGHAITDPSGYSRLSRSVPASTLLDYYNRCLTATRQYV